MTVIKVKNSNVSGRLPAPGDIEPAELAINLADKKLYSKDVAGSVFEIGVAGDIPSGIAPPSAGNNVGDLYFDTAVGRLLYWDGSGWQPVAKSNGDNFTGNVTLGTDKITLNATTGEVWLADHIFFTEQFNQLRIGEASQVAPGGTAGDLGIRSGTNIQFFLGDMTEKIRFTPNGSITANGSGNFTGDIFSNDPLVKASTGGVLGSKGGLYTRCDSSVTEAFKIYKKDVDLATCTITSEGAATFAGNVQVGPINLSNTANTGVILWKEVGITTIAASGPVFRGYLTGGTAPTSLIDVDGTAKFSGDIFSNDPLVKASTGGVMGSKGGLYTRCDSSVTDAFKIYKKDVDLATCTITSDGSAEFASTVTAGNATTGPQYAFDSVSRNGYALRSFNADAAPGSVEIDLYDKCTAVIRTDGSSEFAGALKIADGFQPTQSDKSGTSIFAAVNTQLASNFPGTTAVFQSYYGTSNTFVVTANGAATFQGTVTATVVPPSDARFKENITAAKPQLADVVALGGLLKNYDWNDQAPLNEEIRSQRQLGLIAQEAEKVCPAIVKDIKRSKTVEVKPAVLGPKGKVVITEAVTEEVDDSYKGISTDALIMKLIGAVAELSAEVTALKAAKLTKK